MDSEFVLDPNVWEQDEGIQNDADETARIYKLKKTLSPIREPKEHRLAPYQEGSYYVWVKYTDTKNNEAFVLSDPDTHKSTFQGLIPIAFLAELGPDEVDWEDVKEFKESVELADWNAEMANPRVDPDMARAEMLTESIHDKVAEKDFIDSWRNCWFIRKIKSKSECWIPTRDGKGRLDFRCQGPSAEYLYAYKKEKDAIAFKTRWYKVLDSTWQRRSSPPQGRPPRWARVSLPDGLKVYFHTDQVPAIGQVDLKECVEGVNAVKQKEVESLAMQLKDATNRLNSAGSDNEKRQLLTTEIAYTKKRLQETWLIEHVSQVPDEMEWFKLSTSPFGLYSTYISEKDWNVYMRGLAEDVPDQKCESVPRPLVPPKWTTQTNLKAANKVQEVYKAFLDATGDPNRTAKTVEDTVVKLAASMKSGLGHKYQHLVDLMDHGHFRSYTSGVKFDSKLNHPKIETASGKRDHEHSQGAIMKVSASDVAEELGWHHVRNIGRNDKQMKNYLYTAEWLHLRAYSWGGHLDTEEYQGLTSQMPLNLVLGTSETNSVMLRYEKAWQNLYTFEHGLQTKLGADPDLRPSGKLWILTNPSTLPQNTMWSEEDMRIRSLAGWEGLDYIETDQYDPLAPENRRFTRRKIQIDNDMRDLTIKYPWIAHSIAYYVSMDTYSHALDRKSTATPLIFYPFRRSFFHRAESLLDNLLFAELKKFGKRRAVETLTTSAEDDSKKKKILGKDYEKQPNSTGKAGKGKGKAALTLRQKKGVGWDKQQGAIQEGKAEVVSPGSPRPTKTWRDDLNQVREGHRAEEEKRTNALEDETTDPQHRQVGGPIPTTYINPFLQPYQQQQGQRQVQQDLTFYDFISLGTDKLKKQDSMKIEEPQTEQRHQQPVGLVSRQLGADGGYFKNDDVVKVLSMGTNQQLMDMRQGYYAMIGGIKQGGQDFTQSSKNGKTLN